MSDYFLSKIGSIVHRRNCPRVRPGCEPWLAGDGLSHGEVESLLLASNWTLRPCGECKPHKPEPECRFNSDLQADFADIVRSTLRKRRMPQREFAVKLGIQENAVSRVLTGKDGISMERAQHWAKVLDLSLRMLGLEEGES